MDGILDGTTYLSLRDAIIKAALDEPRAVLIDVTILAVPAPSAWAVFTSARWHISQWPDVPIALICAHIQGRHTVRRNGITRYVPVYRTIESAVGELPPLGERRYRRRARAELPISAAGARRCRELTSEWLTSWSTADFIPVVSTVATVFIEHAIAHPHGVLAIRLESDSTTVTVAVEDSASSPVARREPMGAGDGLSDLDIVTAVSRAWGSAPTTSGKTTWAVIGPEHRL